jgi:proton-dependent oligopeptide transporter, POT family
MVNTIKNYFAEFKVLKTASKEFWLINAITFFDGLAYFSMVNIITLYLTSNIGFSDVDSGAWVGIYTLYVTAFIFGVGAVCDVIGIKKSYYIGLVFLVLARLGMGMGPKFFSGETLQYVVMGLLLVTSLGTAFMGPIHNTAMRRFTTKENRSTGFNVYYLIMNVGAIFAGFAVTDGFRNWLGEIQGNLAIMNFGFVMYAISFVCTWLINEENYSDEDERLAKHDLKGQRPLRVFLDVWKEKPFQKLVLFLFLTIGVRLVFTHQFLVMPKYYTRVLYGDFDLGLANSINPFIIIVGLILLIPIINRFDTFKLIVVGMAVSAASLIFMMLPIHWYLSVPGIHNLNQAYLFVIFAQITVFAIGELIFSPRFSEYTAIVAPKDKVASYMSLAALPMFIAKPINGFISGLLIANYSYDGIRAKIDTNNIAYGDSPEYMWMIYFLLAVLSPIAVIAMKRVLTATHEEKAPDPTIVPIVDPEAEPTV